MGSLRRALHDMAGGFPRTYWVLWIGTLVNRLGSFVVPFLALYLTRERGFSVERAGLVVSLYGVGAVIASPLGGMLADRVGRRITLAGGLWLGSIGMVCLGFARDPVAISVAAFCLGIMGELYRPAVSAAITDVVSPEDRQRAFGLLYWVINVGFAIAVPMAGLMVRYGYLTLFIADAITTFTYGCCIWFMLPETRPAQPPKQDTSAARSAASSLLAPFRDPAFLAFAVPVFGVSVIFYQSQVALPMDLSARGLTEAQFGTVLAVNGALIVLLQPFTSRVLKHLRRAQALAIAAVLTGLGFGLHSVSAHMGLAACAVAVWTLGEMLQAPVAPSVVADLAPPGLRGSYQGAFHMLWGLASSVAPALGGWILGRAGSSSLWMTCLVLGFVCAAWQLVIADSRRRRLDAQRALRTDLSPLLD
ncbi:major facilitator family transporter [Myxococcus stipitatus DSM 14675]|uniref:Major facilitator family transporter n=1 Tax=Myxococcus stipitatus (strain DSM 14675 / JCM 12634 / Mx s8) TaxID=1278073 RepID=L7U6Q9_MYXSD|nr:MFS transporter [Myxococcus stipitatus]AGC42164.1 major facilitator family transporter [Myxococcus stipitatus DSM 14675]